MAVASNQMPAISFAAKCPIENIEEVVSKHFPGLKELEDLVDSSANDFEVKSSESGT